VERVRSADDFFCAALENNSLMLITRLMGGQR
jgi:hypothetical protein